jgi:hypothetical protein
MAMKYWMILVIILVFTISGCPCGNPDHVHMTKAETMKQRWPWYCQGWGIGETVQFKGIKGPKMIIADLQSLSRGKKCNARVVGYGPNGEKQSELVDTRILKKVSSSKNSLKTKKKDLKSPSFSDDEFDF